MLRPRRPPRRAVRCTLCRVSHNNRVLAAAWAPRRSQCCLRCMGSGAARGLTRSSGNRCCASTSTGTRRTARNRQHHALPHARAHARICTRSVVRRCADVRALSGGVSVGGTNYLHAPADMGRLHTDGRGSHTHGNALYTQRYSMPTNLSAHCRLYHSIPIFYEDPAFAHVLALINPRALQPLSTSCCSSSSTSLLLD